MGTYSQGSYTQGSTPTATRDVGYGLLVKEVSIAAAGGASLDVAVHLPDGAQLVDVLLDTTTAHTSATATIAGGTTVGGTDLLSATDIKAAGRVRPTFTAAQLAALRGLPHVSGQSDSPVNLRLALATPTSTGVTKVLLLYAPILS